MKAKNYEKANFTLVVTILLVAALTRFVPHPYNFTAIGAMALFSGFRLGDKRIAFLLPMLIMLVTDFIIGFHDSMLPVYACFAFTVIIGIYVKELKSFSGVMMGSLLSSTLFFLVTNLPVWYAGIGLYPVTIEGTMQSYLAAIPFFGNQILGDLFYNGVFFGVYYVISKKAILVIQPTDNNNKTRL